MSMIGTDENLRLLNELVERNYGNVPRGPSEVKNLAKTDAPILSTTTGFFNTTFGASIFQQLNNSSTLFNLLPKFQYQRGGFRVQTDRFIASGLGVAQNASIPDSVKATQAQITVGIKEQAIAIEYSERMRLLQGTKDDVGFDVQATLERAKANYTYALDADLNVNATTVASANVESIDRICSSYAEVTNCADINANDVDIYGLDRDAEATYADAYVSHGSGTTRAISESIVRSLIKNTVAAGANPSTQVWYTGTDTYEQIMAMFQTQMRYTSPEAFRAKTNVNTGESAGANFGMEMGTLFGRPIYVAPAGKVAASGSAGYGAAISNLYLLDTGMDPIYNEPILGMKVLQAPILAETKLATYPAHGKLGNEVVIYSAMELECKRFNVQGKARDLAAAF